MIEYIDTGFQFTVSLSDIKIYIYAYMHIIIA